MENKVQYDLDLDIIQNKAVKIKLNGKVYELKKPSTKTALGLLRVASKFDSQDMKNAKPEDVEELYSVLLELFSKIIPDLPKKEIEDLDLDKLQKLMGIMFKEFNPKQEELKKHGINVSLAQKKTLSSSSEK